MNEDEWIEHDESEYDPNWWEPPTEYEDMELDFAN